MGRTPLVEAEAGCERLECEAFAQVVEAAVDGLLNKRLLLLLSFPLPSTLASIPPAAVAIETVDGLNRPVNRAS